MCGICGVVGVQERQEGEGQTRVRRMLAALEHRGPDDEGLLVEGTVAIGMRRLSIIDLQGGSQPVWNEDGSVAVVFNGEIYNFGELQRMLAGRGHRFRTRSDTEAIVHAYEEWGEDCVHQLRGMFALAVYDRRAQGGPRVFLARDRLGIKPLYWAKTREGGLIFASEVRALLASGLVARKVSREALESYLTFGSVGEPMTLVEGVGSLPPGHRMTISDFGFRISDLSGISDFGFRIAEIGTGWLRSRSRTGNSRCPKPKAEREPQIRNSQFAIRNPKTEPQIRNSQFAIRNPRSRTPNSKFEIRNPKSVGCWKRRWGST